MIEKISILILKKLKKVFITVLGRLLFSIATGIAKAVKKGLQYLLTLREEKRKKKEEGKAASERAKVYKEALSSSDRTREDVKNATEELLNSRRDSGGN